MNGCLFVWIRRKLLLYDASCVDRCMHADRVLLEKERKEGREGDLWCTQMDRAEGGWVITMKEE